jgi:hypothetical protein
MPKRYPEPTNTMPLATVGPGAPIEPPWAAIPFTVVNSQSVLYSQSERPSLVENARTTPSMPPEKTTPGIVVSAAVSPPSWSGACDTGRGVNHFLLPVFSCTAVTPPLPNPKYAFFSSAAPPKIIRWPAFRPAAPSKPLSLGGRDRGPRPCRSFAPPQESAVRLEEFARSAMSQNRNRVRDPWDSFLLHSARHHN